MKDLSFAMISYLFSHGELGIPGVGTLYVKKLPAKRMVHEAKIYGPTLLIDFNEDTKLEDSTLTAELVNKLNWSRSKADKNLRKLGSKIINELLNFGESQLNHLGWFRKTENNGYVFEMDPALHRTFQMAYPDLPLVVIPDKKKQAISREIRDAYLYGPTFEKKEKIGWFFPLLALIATSLLLACLITCFLQKNFKSSFVPIVKKPVQSDSPKPVQEENTLIFNTDTFPEEVDLIDQTGETNQQNLNDSALNESIDTSLNTGSTDSIQSDNDSQNTFNYGNFEGIQEMSLDEILQQSAAKRLDYNNPCMIVVGSYLRRDLIEKMVNQLQKKNHDIYIEKYGGFYRTAIIYECDTRNTSGFLKQVRQEIEAKAWILQY